MDPLGRSDDSSPTWGREGCLVCMRGSIAVAFEPANGGRRAQIKKSTRWRVLNTLEKMY